jgi:alpha-1,2-glucosyltransferase
MRYVNGLVLFNLLPLSLRTLLKRIRQSNLLSGTATTSTELNLTALNICLFPPVFFFSGLYYTDLAALVIVLQVYAYDLKRQATPKLGEDVARPGYFSWSTLLFPGFGLLALVFRQTNIFWVAVFLGGLRVIRTLKSRTTECNASHPVDIIRSSWELGQLFDPLVSEAYFEGNPADPSIFQRWRNELIPGEQIL